jgi:hypothetical protein
MLNQFVFCEAVPWPGTDCWRFGTVMAAVGSMKALPRRQMQT